MTRLSNACRSRQFPPATNQQWLIKAFSISYCSFADLSTSIIVTFIESWWLIATNFLHSQQRIKFEDIFILDEYLAEEFLKKNLKDYFNHYKAINRKFLWDQNPSLESDICESVVLTNMSSYLKHFHYNILMDFWKNFFYSLSLFLNSGYNLNYKSETDVFYFKELRNTNQKIYILHNLITGLKALI